MLFLLLAPSASASSGQFVPTFTTATWLTSRDICGVHQFDLWKYSEEQIDKILGKIHEAGIKWLRMGFCWYDIEPFKDEWNTSRHNIVVEKAASRGIHILGILSATPKWANDNNASSYPPINLEDWNAYVARLSAEFAGRVSAWEIWNEQNIGFFTVPEGQDKVATYMNLVRRASYEIRTHDPEAKVVLGGVAGFDPDFIEKCLTPNNGPGDEDPDRGATHYVDAIAFHPYTTNHNTFKSTHPHENDARTMLQNLRDTIRRYDSSGKLTLWITEIGWTNAQIINPAIPAIFPPVDKPTQAAYLLRTYINYLDDAYNAAGDPPIEKIFYHNLWDDYDKDNVLLRTNDGGNTWTRLPMARLGVDACRGVEGLAVKRLPSGSPDQDVVICTGPQNATNAVAISSDSGSNWLWYSLPLAGHSGEAAENLILKSASMVNPYLSWIVGSNGSIYKGIDFGLGMSFTHQPSGTTAFLNAVNAVDQNVVWVAGENGIVLKTTNGGANWTVMKLTDRHLYDISALNDNVAWVVGQGGLILKTSDGGVTWNRQAAGITQNDLKGVHSIDVNIAWAVGEGGVILKTTNGVDWTTLHSHTDQSLNDVKAFDINTAWTVGDGATILKTTDGGTNWTKLNVPEETDVLNTVEVIDDHTVYAAGYKEPWPCDEHPEADPLGVIPLEVYNYGLLDYKMRPKPAFNYMRRLVEPNPVVELFGDASALPNNGLFTFSNPPSTLEKHIFLTHDGSLLLCLWNSDVVNGDPDISVTFTLNQAGYENPVAINLVDGSPQPVPGISRGQDARISVSNLVTGKTPIILKFPSASNIQVLGITPSRGSANTTVNITNLAGIGFIPGAMVRLETSGQNPVLATNVTVVSSNQITCTLDLTNAAAGTYDVVVINPDGNQSKLIGGFTVDPAECGTGAAYILPFGFFVGLATLKRVGKRRRRKTS